MTCILYFLILMFGSLLPLIEGLKHNFVVTHDARTLIAPIGAPYGFLKGGCFGFDVVDFSLETGRWNRWKRKRQPQAISQEVSNSVEVGFLLKRFTSESAFTKYEEEVLSDPKICIFEPFRGHEEDPVFAKDDDFQIDTGEVMAAATDGIFVPVVRRAGSTWSTKSPSFMYQFKEGESGLYFLMYQICSNSTVKPDIRSSFAIDFHYKNTDFLGKESYLTAGEMPLPIIFFYFSVSYLGCWLVWTMNIRSINRGNGTIFGGSTFGHRVMVYPIHHLMSVLLFVKTLTTFFESVRYHFLRITGHAAFWSVIYHILSFLKGLFLFTTILLIGSGWSFVKPFLTEREKKLIFFVLVLQVLDNIALIVLANETEGEIKYDEWSAILHLVDIICCCAVLFPIFWQVSALEQKIEDGSIEINPEDGDETKESPESPAEISEDDARTLSKLKLFRSFYLMVVAYIYTTRILVYLLATVLDFKHTYVRYLVTELATLGFYVMTGLQFRPMPENPYLPIINKKGDIEHEIEFENDRGEVELADLGMAMGKMN